VAKEPTQKQVEQALEVSNRLSTMQVRSLQFTASKEDGRTIIKVVDTQNDEVIRQIPSEEFVKMAERISDLTQQLDSAQGLLFESKV
jgi:flagellar protein FlaG